MKTKKHNKNKKVSAVLKEPAEVYNRKKKSSIKIFSSFEEQAEENRKQMAALKPIERLKQMRQMIHLAWALKGFDWNKLPKKHNIKILSK